MLANVFSTDVPNAEAVNIWVLLAGALVPFILQKLNIKLPFLPSPSPAPTPTPAPTPSLNPAPNPININDFGWLVWLLFKKFIPNLPDLKPGEPLTEAHVAALVKAELPSSVKPN